VLPLARGGEQLRSLRFAEPERRNKTANRSGIWFTTIASLEIGNTATAQACALRKLFLRESGCGTEAPQQRTELPWFVLGHVVDMAEYRVAPILSSFES
jgi:hypothetical protein